MTTRTAEYLEAIEHLPNGAVLLFSGVSWEDYEHLTEDLADRPGLRVAYDEGTLEIMSPLPPHEEYKETILLMTHALAGIRHRCRNPWFHDMAKAETEQRQQERTFLFFCASFWAGGSPPQPRRGGRDVKKISRSLLDGADGVVLVKRIIRG